MSTYIKTLSSVQTASKHYILKSAQSAASKSAKASKSPIQATRGFSNVVFMKQRCINYNQSNNSNHETNIVSNDDFHKSSADHAAFGHEDSAGFQPTVFSEQEIHTPSPVRKL